jgi:hypothetical protein
MPTSGVARLLRRARGWLAFLTVVGVLAALVGLWVAAIWGPPPCAPVDPCTPTPWTPVALGLAVAAPLTVLLHPWVGAALAAGVGLAWWQAGRETALPWWSRPCALAFVALAVILAAILHVHLRRLRRDEPWLPPRARTRGHLRPPEPSAQPWVARRMAVWAAVLLVGAGGVAAAAVHAQRAADGARATAPGAEGVVTENDSRGGRLTARLDDGTRVKLWLFDSTPYPVGSRQRFYRTGSGGIALSRDPENHTWWLFWSAFLGGLGLMLATRVVAHNRAVRRLFAEHQPVRPVRFVEDGAGVHVLLQAGQFTPDQETTPLLRFPVRATTAYRMQRTGLRPVWPLDFPTDDMLAQARPARLYGHPGDWRWCLLATDTRVLVPQGPATLDWRVTAEQDDGDRPEPPDHVDPEPAASSSPRATSTHRAGHALPYLYAAGAGLASGVLLGRLLVFGAARLDQGGLATLTLWLVVGVGIDAVWRWRMVSRAAWNDAGVAVVTSDGVHHLGWPDVTSIDEGRGSVRLRTADGEIEVYCRDSVRRWPVNGERSTNALAAELRDSRRRALSVPAEYRPGPPPLAYPLWPVRLWALWLAETALLLALLHLLLRL